MLRKRTRVPPQLVVVASRSFDQSSPVTTGPVPSPSIGSLIVTDPFVKLPITPPRPEMVIVPRASRMEIVPSFDPRGRAADAAGRASATSTAKVRNRLIAGQYRPCNCALHQWNVRKL